MRPTASNGRNRKTGAHHALTDPHEPAMCGAQAVSQYMKE